MDVPQHRVPIPRRKDSSKDSIVFCGLIITAFLNLDLFFLRVNLATSESSFNLFSLLQPEYSSTLYPSFGMADPSVL